MMQIYRIGYYLTYAHTPAEILAPIRQMLNMPDQMPGVVVETGSFQGGGTAKLSLAARLCGRRLVVFDSFEGIPDNVEPHDRSIDGSAVQFAKGSFSGTLEEVTRNVRRFGDIGVCHFVKGYFDKTMPTFHEAVAIAYLDVDLAQSTRTCLLYLWPLLTAGGFLFSQDGHLSLVLDVFVDRNFWRRELKTEAPEMNGFRKNKLIFCRKASLPATAFHTYPGCCNLTKNFGSDAVKRHN